jgi:hypothetical protein
MAEQFNLRLSDLHAYTLRKICNLTDEAIGSYLERAVVIQIENDIKTKMPEKWQALREEMDQSKQTQ